MTDEEWKANSDCPKCGAKKVLHGCSYALSPVIKCPICGFLHELKAEKDSLMKQLGMLPEGEHAERSEGYDQRIF